ncbi:MAG: zinc-binding dehydrogenase [Gaiella sp.]
MQALRVVLPGELRVEQIPEPVADASEVVVELRCAALNRRDTYVRAGRYSSDLPLTPGSDGAGVRRDNGEEVVIDPSLRWGDAESAPGPGWEILGGPTDGTHAELVVVPESAVHPKPPRLSWEEAAALPLAGLTAYRALFVRGGLRAGETVLVLGAGSGVSTFLVQLAVQAGARALVMSSSQAKLDRAWELGARGGVLYTDDGWPTAVRDLAGGGVDLVVDSVGSTWAASLETLRPGGRLVVFGGTGGQEATIPVRPFFWEQLTMLGTTMGSPRDFAGLLRAVEAGTWSPVIDSVRPLADAIEAYDRIDGNDKFGKLVLDCR